MRPVSQSRWGLLLVVTSLLLACSGSRNGSERPPSSNVMQWYDDLAARCGQAFEGRVVNAPDDVDGARWRQATPRLYLRSCEGAGMVLQVERGEDRSLALLLGRVDADGNLRLRHVLHEADGNPAEHTGHGGVGRFQAADNAVEFPLEDALRQAYSEQGLDAYADSVWVLRQERDLLVYEQRSGAGRLYVEFDLSSPVEAPAASWMEQPIR